MADLTFRNRNSRLRHLNYFASVEATGVPVVITDRGKPKLEIRRCGEPARKIELASATLLRD